MPALVAAVTGDDGTVEGVQRTWLDPKRPAKADLGRPRKALGRVHGRAVRFSGTASGATLLAGEGIETVLSLVTAVARHSCRGGSIGGQPRRLRTTPQISPCWSSPAIKTCRVRARREPSSAPLCVERGIPSIVIVPEHSDFNDDLIAIGEETLAARIATLIATAPSPRQRRKRGVGVRENNHPVMMSHCPTRSHCANPCGVLHSAHAPLRR